MAEYNLTKVLDAVSNVAAAAASSRASQDWARQGDGGAACSAGTTSTAHVLSSGPTSKSRVTELSRGVSPKLARRRRPSGPESVRHPAPRPSSSRRGVQRKALSLGVDGRPCTTLQLGVAGSSAAAASAAPR